MSLETERPVLCRIDESGIATLTVNRPDKLNALNLAVKACLKDQIESLSHNEQVKVIILTGAGDVFVAGTDVSEMKDMTPSDHVQMQTGAVFEALRACPKPVIAAVEKYALGGGLELALACDLIVAEKNAKLGQPEIRVGIMPGAGGSQLLLRTIGKYKTMKLIMTGEPIDAGSAEQWGLVSEVTEPGEALSRATEIAGTLLKMPPLSLAAIKRAVNFGFDAGLSPALKAERLEFIALFDTDDQREGMEAFIEKRKPDYQGR